MFTVIKHRRKSFRAVATNDNFEFTVTTTTSNETFTIPCQNVGTFDATVDWGDGSTSTITAYNDADLVHTYATAGDHNISISGTFPNIYFNSGGDKLKVKSVTNLGSVGWTTFFRSFYGCSNMTSFTAGDCDTSGVTDMSSAFLGCSSLTSLDVSSFDTSSVTNMSVMFSGCRELTSLDVSSFNTSSVTNMSSMFSNCRSLTSLDVSSFNTSSVTTMYQMFSGCTSLTSLDVSSFNTSSVTNMGYMFSSCTSLTSLDVSSFNTSSVTNMGYMFSNCTSLTSLDLSSFNTSSVTSMQAMFNSMGGGTAQLTITGIEDFDITSVTVVYLLGITLSNLDSLMASTGGLSTTVYDELLVNWEGQTGYATNHTPDFGGSKYTANSTAATARADLITTGWTITDGGSIANNNFEFTVTTTTASETFTIPCQNAGTFNATVDWGDGSATSTITAYNDADLTHTYATAGDHNISISGTFPNIYFNNSGDTLKVKSVTNLGSVGWATLRRAFWGCSNMTSFNGGDCDTSAVINMENFFRNCSSLTSADVSSFDTSSVTSMFRMFQDCSSLTSVDLSSFDTSSCTTGFSNFLSNTNSLASVDISSFDVSNCTGGAVSMFQNMGTSVTSQVTITGIEDLQFTGLNTNRMSNFLSGTSISTTVYDELLVNFAALTWSNVQNPNFGGSKYTANSTAATARADLVTAGWSITDGGTETLIETHDGGSSTITGRSTDEWLAGDFTAQTTTTYTSIDVKLAYYSADTSDSISAAIYTNNGSDEPGTLVGEEYARDLPLTSTGEWYRFTVNAAVTASTSYVIVIKAPDGGLPSPNGIYVYYDNTFDTGRNIKESGDSGTSWSTTQSNKKIAYRLYE